MKNLLTLTELSNQEIMDILTDAVAFSNGQTFSLAGKIVANLFFEPSTRTEYSFVMAQQLLDIKPISFNKASSSFFNKGETFKEGILIGRGGFNGLDNECRITVQFGSKRGSMISAPPDYRTVSSEKWLEATAEYWASMGF